MRPSRRQTQPFTRRWSPGRPSATVLLVAIHVGAFAAQWLLQLIEQDRFSTTDWLWSWLALDGAGIGERRYWQFATFGLLHQGPLHAAANLLILFFAGREVEPVIGRRPFVALYLLGILGGGLAHWLVMPDAALVGVSGGVAAVVAAYATLLPELELGANLFFIIPLRMRAKFLGFVALASGGLCWVANTAPTIGPAGIVAGCAIGWAFMRRLGFGNLFAWQRWFYERRQRATRLERMTAEQFMTAEMNPLLEKIAREGVRTLTRAERKLLEQGRAKLAVKPAQK